MGKKNKKAPIPQPEEKKEKPVAKPIEKKSEKKEEVTKHKFGMRHSKVHRFGHR